MYYKMNSKTLRCLEENQYSTKKKKGEAKYLRRTQFPRYQENGKYYLPFTASMMNYLSKAVKNNEISTIEQFFDYGLRIDDVLMVREKSFEMTLLHLACKYRNGNMVKILIKNYHVNIHTAVNDGIQPIHMACCHYNQDCLRLLLEAGANANAVITREIFRYFLPESDWNNDFGDEMTLVTYAIIYRPNESRLAKTLIKFQADLSVKSLSNKTLLMYAIEKEIPNFAKYFKCKKEYRKLVHVRDNEDFLAIHYLLHPKKYEDYQFHGSQLGKSEYIKKEYLKVLIEMGADINATIKNEMNTMLLIMAAWRCSLAILKILLPYYGSITRPEISIDPTRPTDLNKLFCPTPTVAIETQQRLLSKQRIGSYNLVLKDIMNRRSFGLPVPKSENLIVDYLSRNNPTKEELVNSYEHNFIEKILKNTTIQYDDKNITHFDFIKKSYDDKKLRLLVRDKILINNWISSPIRQHADYQYFNALLRLRMKIAMKRNALLDELKKVQQLRKTIPLPYECVIEIIEYLNNDDLEKFISAFYVIFRLKKIELFIF